MSLPPHPTLPTHNAQRTLPSAFGEAPDKLSIGLDTPGAGQGKPNRMESDMGPKGRGPYGPMGPKGRDHIIDGYPLIFIDGYPSMNVIDGPSMNIIDGYPSMNINGYPVL